MALRINGAWPHAIHAQAWGFFSQREERGLRLALHAAEERREAPRRQRRAFAGDIDEAESLTQGRECSRRRERVVLGDLDVVVLADFALADAEGPDDAVGAAELLQQLRWVGGEVAVRDDGDVGVGGRGFGELGDGGAREDAEFGEGGGGEGEEVGEGGGADEAGRAGEDEVHCCVCG